jgi:hypothetical protein
MTEEYVGILPSTDYTRKFERLREPFPACDIEWRIGRAGEKKDGNPWATALAYVTSRAIMDRLDAVMGPENWYDEYTHLEKGVVCTLYLFICDRFIGKADGAPETNFEGFKGGISGALKRAAVKWGIGRYLYDIDECFALTSFEKKPGWKYATLKTGKAYYWQIPDLPAWALPRTSVDVSKEILTIFREITDSYNHEQMKQFAKDHMQGIESLHELTDMPKDQLEDIKLHLEQLREDNE